MKLLFTDDCLRHNLNTKSPWEATIIILGNDTYVSSATGFYEDFV